MICSFDSNSMKSYILLHSEHEMTTQSLLNLCMEVRAAGDVYQMPYLEKYEKRSHLDPKYQEN